MRDRYLLVAYGDAAAVGWMFPMQTAHSFECVNGKMRHVFKPADQPITVERDLRRVCAAWQERWNTKLEDALLQSQPVASGGQSALPVIVTLGQLFDFLYDQRKATVAKSTCSRDRYRLQVWRDALGNGTALVALTPDRIATALAAIAQRTSPCTANTALGVLKTYLTWAGNMGLVPNQSHRTVKRIREPQSHRHHRAWWTTDEIALVLRCAEHDPHQATAVLLVACGCYLGLRPEEIIMQRWTDLDLDAVDPTTATPRPVCHVVEHDGWKPKDGEARDIPISTELLAILRRFRQQEGYLLNREPHRKGRPRGGTGWIYRYDPKALWKRLMRAVVIAGGKEITMYGMRHSFASNLLINNVSDVKVSRWLGHSDTRMLHRHYGHLRSYDDDINRVG